MEKMRRIAALLMAVMMSAAVFTGCGDSDDDDDTAKGSKKKSAAVDDNDDDEDDDEEEETTKRVRKRQPKDEEEDTTEPETEEETTEEVTEEETTEPETEPETEAPADAVTYDLMYGIKLRMSAEDAEKIMSEQFVGEPVKTEGYYMTYSLSYPCTDVLGTGLDGYFFLEFGEKDDQLKCYGYHIGAVGDPEKSEYPYDEAELKAAFTRVEDILIEQYGESTQNNGLEEMGVKKEYSTILSDSTNVWAMYGTDLWSLDEPSGINEAVVSYSVPDTERY